MAKFYGVIGYSITTEAEPGVWIDEITERSYTGDVIKKASNWKFGDQVNPDFTISDTISIVADGFTLANMQFMKYVKWRDATWAINSVQIERPRVILEIGGLYSGRVSS
jgi:hypothetical protein